MSRRKQNTNDWMEIGDILTDEGFERLGVGDVLRFKEGDKLTEMKVMRINKPKRKCYVKETRTYTPEEFEQLVKRK